MRLRGAGRRVRLALTATGKRNGQGEIVMNTVWKARALASLSFVAMGLGAAEPAEAQQKRPAAAATTPRNGTAAPAGAQKLPPPFVSRSLNAVLMPLTPVARRDFGIDKMAFGVLVVAVQPKGIAANAGIKPGDVIARVKGKSVNRPVDLDTAVYFWLKRGVSEFGFDGFRGKQFIHPKAKIGPSAFDTVVDLLTIGAWLAAPSPKFDYGRYYSSYRPAVERSYRAAPVYIEQTIVQQNYYSETVSVSTSETNFESYAETHSASAQEDATDASGDYVDFDGTTYDTGDDEIDDNGRYDPSDDDDDSRASAGQDDDQSADSGDDDDGQSADSGDDDDDQSADSGDDQDDQSADSGDDDDQSADSGDDDGGDQGDDDSGDDDGGDDDSGGDDDGG